MSFLNTTEVIIITILSLYPILGAMFWFWGAVAYVIFRRKDELPKDKKLDHEPFITIMVPAHNDKTPEILHRMQEQYSKLRVIRVEKNSGKAHAFNIGMFFAKGEYILSNDADTVPESDVLNKYMLYFLVL